MTLTDFSDLDTFIHEHICTWFGRECATYRYDLPFWEVLVSLGTILAAYFAYAAIKQSNRQLNIGLTPYLVLVDRVTTNADNTVQSITVENVGKGSAINVWLSSDQIGGTPLADSSNPHSHNISPGKRVSWALDDNQLKKGLITQRIISQLDFIALPKSTPAFDIIPDELTLEDHEKYKSDFHIYIWYEDQTPTKWRTTVTVRHSGYFLKVMGHVIESV